MTQGAERWRRMEPERRWGIALMTAFTLGLGAMVLLPSGRAGPAHEAPREALLPPAPLAAPPPVPLKSEVAEPAPPDDAPPEDEDAQARAQAAFWVWPLVGAGLQDGTQFDD